MTEDIRALLKSLPPELSDPADRVERVKARTTARRRHRLVALAAVAAVAVTVPVSVVLSTRTASGPATRPAPLTCPNVYGGPAPWVPDGPRGVDGTKRLVPPQPPTRAVVCAYSGQNAGPQTGWLRDGSRVVTGGLDRLAADLTLVGRRPGKSGGCTLIGGEQVNYLLGLNYDKGTLWVSATDEPNHCVDTSNGRYTALDVSDDVAAAYRTGTWSGPSPVPSPTAIDFPCHTESRGRLGQEMDLVPPGVTSALICPEPIYRGGRSVTLTGDELTDLVDALNRLPTSPTISSCERTGNPAPRDYELLFRYPSGPAVVVRMMTGCRPSITNGSLDVTDAAPVVDRIGRLAG